MGMTAYIVLSTLDEQTIVFGQAKQQINVLNIVAMIRTAPNDFEAQQYSTLLQKIEDWNAPPTTSVDSGSNDDPGVPSEPDKPKVEIVGAKDLNVTFAKPLLESEADVEAYIDSYKRALLDGINKGKKIRI